MLSKHLYSVTPVVAQVGFYSSRATYDHLVTSMRSLLLQDLASSRQVQLPTSMAVPACSTKAGGLLSSFMLFAAVTETAPLAVLKCQCMSCSLAST
jgi:hypothetical protein